MLTQRPILTSSILLAKTKQSFIHVQVMLMLQGRRAFRSSIGDYLRGHVKDCGL